MKTPLNFLLAALALALPASLAQESIPAIPLQPAAPTAQSSDATSPSPQDKCCGGAKKCGNKPCDKKKHGKPHRPCCPPPAPAPVPQPPVPVV